MFYFDLLLPHMSTICIHKRNQTYSLSPLPSPPPRTAPTCCTATTCFSKELTCIFHFTETVRAMQMFIEDQDFFLYLTFPPFFKKKKHIYKSVFCCWSRLLACWRSVRSSLRVITRLTVIDLISAKLHFSALGIL